MSKKYDIIIVGAGPAGIFASYELSKTNPALKIAMIEKGQALDKRHCPIEKTSKCMGCKQCGIMNGFGGAGGFSDGKYNITNNFGGDLYRYVGEKEAIALMKYVDQINLENGGQGCKLYSTANADIKQAAITYDLHLMDASVRHLGTDVNKIILGNLYKKLKENISIFFEEEVEDISHDKYEETYTVKTNKDIYIASKVIIAVGRSGSKWMSGQCENLDLSCKSNRVDIGVRVELPELVFHNITQETYEAKIMYRTKKYQDTVRTFCMNPYGEVVTENTNGIVTVNGHSYSDPNLRTENTNFALLVSNTFTAPFNDSNAYGEHIARLANMLSGGVLVQRFGDLINGQRTTEHRLSQSFTKPTLNACPGDLSLVLPKRQLDDIVEMIYALDKIAPGTANADTLLYGVEVKFYNSTIEVNNNFETTHKGLYVIGDCGGTSHSLSVAAAEGVHVARVIAAKRFDD